MQKMVNFELKELIDPEKTDSISGRSFGEGYAEKINLLGLLEENYLINFIIDENIVKAINDSFIKGLFSKVFERFKTTDNIRKNIKLTSNDYFKRLFEKNWIILQDIYNV